MAKQAPALPRPLRAALLFCAALWPVLAAAQTCDGRSQHIAFLREDLRRATMDGDWPTAQDFADRGRREADQLALAAGRCDCGPAQATFDRASKLIKRAVTSDSRQDLRDTLKTAMPLVEEALAQWKECVRR